MAKFYVKDSNVLKEEGFKVFSDGTMLLETAKGFAFTTTPSKDLVCTFDKAVDENTPTLISETVPLDLLTEWIIKGGIGVV